MISEIERRFSVLCKAIEEDKDFKTEIQNNAIDGMLGDKIDNLDTKIQTTINE